MIHNKWFKVSLLVIEKGLICIKTSPFHYLLQNVYFHCNMVAFNFLLYNNIVINVLVYLSHLITLREYKSYKILMLLYKGSKFLIIDFLFWDIKHFLYIQTFFFFYLFFCFQSAFDLFCFQIMKDIRVFLHSKSMKKKQVKSMNYFIIWYLSFSLSPSFSFSLYLYLFFLFMLCSILYSHLCFLKFVFLFH